MTKKDIFFWLLAALILGGFISSFASSWPDGLEKVAEDKGFLERGEVSPIVISPIPDYAWPGIDKERVAAGLAGIFGTLVVFVIGYGIGSIIKKVRQ